ncbi:MAG: type II toxin-antitoxin system HicA family toxin [Thermodesulfovibrionales bacterium]
MPKLPVLKPSEVVKALENIGFYQVRQKGSHLQLKRGNLLVTIPMHSKDINHGTLKSIIRQAKLSTEEFLSLIK